MGRPYWINRWLRRGKERRTEVKQRGEMREGTSGGGMWRGKEMRGNNKEEDIRQGEHFKMI